MLAFVFGPFPSFYVSGTAALLISFSLVRLGHCILDLLRDIRAFRNGD